MSAKLYRVTASLTSALPDMRYNEAVAFQTIDFNRFQAPKKRSSRWRIVVIGIIILVIIAAICFYIFGSRSADKASSATTLKPDTLTKQTAKQNVTSMSAQQKLEGAIDKKRFSNDDPTSIWVIVNKRRPLQPKDFVPQLATPNVPLRLSASTPEMTMSVQAVPSLEAMFAAAKLAGLNLMIASAYRSYNDQVSVYGSEVKAYGQTTADRESARPGFSEHQTGLAVDIEPASRQCEVQDCFGDTPEGKWLDANAHTYGFILRYTPTGEPTTGYRHETWHFRYVGKDLAEEIYKLGNPPLETYFGIEPAPDYQ